MRVLSSHYSVYPKRKKKKKKSMTEKQRVIKTLSVMPDMPIPDLTVPYHTVMPSHASAGSLNHIFLGANSKPH